MDESEVILKGKEHLFATMMKLILCVTTGFLGLQEVPQATASKFT